MVRWTNVVAVLVILASPVVAAEAGSKNLLRGGDFEQGLSGWSPAWSRTPDIQAALDTAVKHGGQQSVRIEHAGSRDWSLAQQEQRKAKPGEIYELSGWVQARGEGSATLGVTLYDTQGKVTDWVFAGRSARGTEGWKLLKSRFVVPPGTGVIWPRLIGDGPSTVWFDDASLSLVGSIDQLRPAGLPKEIRFASGELEVTFHSAAGNLTVRDNRAKKTWEQKASGDMLVLEAAPVERGLRAKMLHPSSMLTVDVRMTLEPAAPELVVELSATGDLDAPVNYPLPMVAEKQTTLILPVNEGMSYPADDPSIEPMWYHLYGGHGLCMPWWGVTDGAKAMMAIVQTPNDAAVRVPRVDGLLTLAPEWLPEKKAFGPARRLRYVFFSEGGYVAMAKRYRQYAKETGLLKTLAEKREANPNVDRLIGAVNVWCWDGNSPELCRELQAAGIGRILWSNAARPEQLRDMNALGVLTSRYDIYQDVMDPATFPKFWGVHPDWPTEAWPKDIILMADGRWQRGWEVDGKDGKLYPCGVLCDRQALSYARRRIPAELKTHPYLCRFIDTTTAAPWNECYSPEHPMTRTESRKFKMDLLRFVSDECRLVTGSETGHDAAVPYVHYFEGMLSLGPYRLDDAGRDMARIVDDPPAPLSKFQTGHFYRLPLWELVYHDCVVAQWYWGDYNNKLPKLWTRRDLFNALYGTPPMFMFTGSQWKKSRDRFVESYKTATPVARATGYREMLSHRWLTPDHAVQETRFAGGVTVTVNFGDQPYAMPEGGSLPPLSHRVQGVQ